MRAIGVKLARLTVTGALIGLFGVLLIYGLWRFCYPYAEEARARREVAQLEQRVRELRAQHRQLEQQAKLLATPEGMRLEARRLGLVKPGERSLRFMTRPQAREVPQPGESAQSGEGAPLLERLRAWGRNLLAPPPDAHGPAPDS